VSSLSIIPATKLTFRLATDLGSFVRLVDLVKRLGLHGGVSIQQRAVDAEVDLVKLVAAIDEIAEGINQMKDLEISITFDGFGKLQEHRDRLSVLMQSVEKVNTVSRQTDAAMFTAGKSKLCIRTIICLTV
jgi:hypothetical protein